MKKNGFIVSQIKLLDYVIDRPPLRRRTIRTFYSRGLSSLPVADQKHYLKAYIQLKLKNIT